MTVVDEDIETLRVVYRTASLRPFGLIKRAVVLGYAALVLVAGWTPGPLQARAMVPDRREGGEFHVQPAWIRRHRAGEWTVPELLERAFETGEPWAPDGAAGSE